MSELAILITAAHWRQQHEWDVHAPIALEAGIRQSVLDAVWKGDAPDGLDIPQQAIHDPLRRLASGPHGVPRLHDRVQVALGEQATMDAIAICGYYAMLAMVLNSQ